MEIRLTKKDLKRLKEVYKAIYKNEACTYQKDKCLKHLKSIIRPRCVVCRQLLDSNYKIVNDKKMHEECVKKYKSI